MNDSDTTSSIRILDNVIRNLIFLMTKQVGTTVEEWQPDHRNITDMIEVE